MRTRTGLVIFLATLAYGSPILGQVGLSEGDRVRFVETDGRPRVTGVVSTVSSDWIVISRDGAQDELLIQRADVARLERSVGRQRRFARNFGITLGVTAATAGIISALAWSPCRATGFLACFMAPDSRGDAFGLGFAGGAILGIPLGVIVGLAVGSEGWEPVTLPGTDGAKITVSPILGSGVGASASIALGGR